MLAVSYRSTAEACQIWVKQIEGGGNQRSKHILWPGMRARECGDSRHLVWEKKFPWRCTTMEENRRAYIWTVTNCSVTQATDTTWPLNCVWSPLLFFFLTQVRCAAGGSLSQALLVRHLQRGTPLPVLVFIRAALGHLGGIHGPRVEGHLEERIQRWLLQRWRHRRVSRVSVLKCSFWFLCI